MAWEWSYSAEGVQNIMANIKRLPEADLIIIFAEQYAYDHAYGKRGDAMRANGHAPFTQNAYRVGLHNARNMVKKGMLDVLIACVQEQAEAINTCENGAFEAWVCPYGCHTVTPDAPDEDDE